jgi:hypothetical protein
VAKDCFISGIRLNRMRTEGDDHHDGQEEHEGNEDEEDAAGEEEAEVHERLPGSSCMIGESGVGSGP